VSLGVCAAALAQPPEAANILTRVCLPCHNSGTSSSGLSLATREAALRGGKRGPALIPGEPGRSLLLSAVRQCGDLKMPLGGRLGAAEVAALEQWVRNGAVWPRLAAPVAPPTSHWAFLAPRRPVAPRVRNTAWVRNPVDRFLLARLEKEKVAPSPEADAVTLLRRVSFDLTGLPPAPAEIDSFVWDRRPDAYQRQVERLLASPHYGERMALHWLDQARYADSDGGSRDEPRQVWRYRDWVVEALNRDMPFDQFVVEQVAGDLLPNATPAAITATGFSRMHPIQIEAGTDREQYRVENVFDRVDTFGTVLLGLSVGCARCHDHKYDPVSQREYYELFAYFNNIDEYGPEKEEYARHNDLAIVHGPLLEFASPEEVARRDALRAQIRILRAELAETQRRSKLAAADPSMVARRKTIEDLEARVPKIETTMIMRELPTPRDAHVLLGGDFLHPGARVEPGYLRSLHPMTAPQPRNRLHLARWLVEPANPLLARVAVNRIWQQYFGRGLVETENDFGAQGAAPTHPDLLDWLATELVTQGWRRKAIDRLILTSAAYRQSSRRRADLDEIDPQNRLLARQSRLRLEAEAIRDASLAAGSLLARRLGGPGVFPPQPANAMAASQLKKTWTASTGDDRYRRGLYTFRWRITPHPAHAVFDAPLANGACTRRARTNTPLQALTLLNDTAYHEIAQAFARRIVREAPADRIGYAWRVAVARSPTPAERARLEQLLASESDAFQTRTGEASQLTGEANPELAAWTAVARVLLNTDEFITRE